MKKQQPRSASTSASSSLRFATEVEARNEDEAEDEDGQEEDAQLPEGEEERARRHAPARRKARRDGDRAHADDVLANGRAEDVAGERAAAPAHLVYDLRQRVVAESQIATPRKNEGTGDHPKTRVPTR